MRRYILLFSSLLVTLTIVAQPSWVKKATKSVFTLKTFDANGSLLASSTGFFVSDDGEAVSSYAPFKGASRAVVIDASGKESPIVCMLGANDTYDVAKFRVAVQKKVSALSFASTALSIGNQVFLLPYRELKKVPRGTVRKAEKFNSDFDYYTIAMQMSENTVGCPLLNEAGEVVGMMQPSVKQGDTLNYAVSARFAERSTERLIITNL